MIKEKIFIFVFLICGLAVASYVFSKQLFSNELYEGKGGNKTVTYDGIETPPTKIPQISANVGPLLQALLERVWATKYFGEPTEIFDFNVYDMPLCDSLPDTSAKQAGENGDFLWKGNSAFLWKQKCLPIEIRWVKNKKDLSGSATVRMLNFDGATEVLEDTFGIIRENSLGQYKIEEDKKEAITKIIKELEPYDPQFPSYYKKRLKTYPHLEKYYFLEKGQEEIRRYFAARGKENALTLSYDPTGFVKKGNVLEYSLTAPAGFFGMENDHKKGKRPK
jgi:hypothetical protein